MAKYLLFIRLHPVTDYLEIEENERPSLMVQQFTHGRSAISLRNTSSVVRRTIRVKVNICIWRY